MARDESALATIISIYHKRLIEYKPGLQPSEYIIPAGSLESPSSLIIDDHVHYLMSPDPLSDGKDVPPIKVPVRAMEAAQSIVMDYITALIEFDNGQQPGIFVVKGGFDDPQIIRTRFSRELGEYHKFQIKWYEALVLAADNFYSTTHSPRGISDLQREAAKQLKLDREWMINTTAMDMAKCPYCMSMIQPGAIFCAACRHVLDKAKYEALKPTMVS